MVSIGDIVIIVSILASAVALPFVANPDFNALKGAYDESLTALLNKSISSKTAKYYPGTIEKYYSSDEFRYKTKIAFGEIELRITRNNGSIESVEVLKNPNATVIYQRLNNGVVNEKWLLKTDIYSLSITKNYTTIKETFHTPSGVCEKILFLGKTEQSCDGEIYDLEDRWNTAKTMLLSYMDIMKNALSKVELIDISDEEWDY